MASPTVHRPAPSRSTISAKGAEQALLLLRPVFTIAPVAFGLDKFVGALALAAPATPDIGEQG